MTTWVREDSLVVSPGVDDTEPDHPAWVKLKRMYDRGDFEKIERMVKFWEALEAFGQLGDMLKRAIIWLGIIIAGYFAFTEWVVKWLRGAVGQP